MVLPAAGEIRTIEGHTRRQPAYRSERARAVFLIPFSTSIADAALQLQSTLGARKVDVSFRPDCTVGPGITPSPTAAAARGLSSSLLPPVGNFTLPQRTFKVYAALKTCQTCASSSWNLFPSQSLSACCIRRFLLVNCTYLRRYSWKKPSS